MKLRYRLILVLLAGFTVAPLAAEPATNIWLGMWEGCLCGGPSHSRIYNQLKDDRAKRMSFGTNITLTRDDAKLAPLALLQQHLVREQAQGQSGLLLDGRGLPACRRWPVIRRPLSRHSPEVQAERR